MTPSPFPNDKRRPRGQSFLVEIKFRQNNCWQGTVQWLEGEKTCSFRSMMEMLSLMHEALEVTAAPDEEHAVRSWADILPQDAATKKGQAQ